MWAILAMMLMAVAGLRAAPPTLAVLAFDSSTTTLAPLGKSMAAMLTTDLAGLKSVRIIERDKLAAAVNEMALGQTGLLDEASAPAVGKALGAQYLLMGTLVEFSGALRLDARVIEVETTKLSKAADVSGPLKDFFKLEKQLAEAIIKQLSLSVTPAERAGLGRSATTSLDAALAFGRGLDAKDRGDAAGAQAAFNEALAKDPKFALAKTALADLKDMSRDAQALGRKLGTLEESQSQTDQAVRDTSAALGDLQAQLQEAVSKIDEVMRDVADLSRELKEQQEGLAALGEDVRDLREMME